MQLHSMPVAEPIGLVAGVVAGRVGSKIGRYLAEQVGVPPWVGGLIGSAACHYLSAALTKAVINAAALDAAGGVANVAVTSPITGVAHGLFDALGDAVPDLAGLFDGLAGDPAVADAIRELLGDALPTTPADVCGALAEAGADPAALSPEQLGAVAGGFAHVEPPPPPHDAPVRFGGFAAVDAINDSQGLLPTCFPESAENFLQLYQADTLGLGNGMSVQVLEVAKAHGWAEHLPSGDWVIPNQYHQAVFNACGIPTELTDFSHEYFKFHLDRQCPIQLGVDSAYFGNPASVSHSVTLVDLQPGPDGRWYYRVLDSANPAQQWYPAPVVEQAARSALYKWPDGFNGRALVSKLPARNWPFRT